MYILMIALLMFVFPMASILTETFLFKSPTGIMLLVGKWFVFWVVGIRLFLAGLRQTLQPQFTAEQIFGITLKEALIPVQELGFANLSIGILGISTLFKGSWVTPAAIVGGLFYGLAGMRHLGMKERRFLEDGAMISDLFAFIVLSGYLAAVLVH